VVARLQKFGAFVTLEGGVDGLIHISKLGGAKRINHPGEVLEQGQSLEVTVEAVDREKRRLSLTLERDEKGKMRREWPTIIAHTFKMPPPRWEHSVIS